MIWILVYVALVSLLVSGYWGQPWDKEKALKSVVWIAGGTLAIGVFYHLFFGDMRRVVDDTFLLFLITLPITVLAVIWIGWKGQQFTISASRLGTFAAWSVEKYKAAWQENMPLTALRTGVGSYLLLQIFVYPVEGVLTVLLVGAVFVVARFFKFKEPSVEKQRPDILTQDATKAAVHARCNNPGGVYAGELDGEPLRVSTEDRAVVIGPPGTGKTAFLVTQLLDWGESGRSFVCLDIKPEIFGIVRERLEKSGYRLLTYNPTAGTGQRYNPLADLSGPESVGELAAALVPASTGEPAVFSETARDLLDAVITHLATKGTPTLPAVREYIGQFDDHKELIRDLKRSEDPDARELAAGLGMLAKNERLLGSVFGTLRSSLRFLRYPAIRDSLDASDFSLGDLAAGKVGLFLQFEERHQETTAQLFSAFIGHLLRYFIDHRNRDAILLLLDEIGNAPALPALVKKLNTIRSRNLPTWLYWQSREQMQPYGEKADEGPNKILAACDVQMTFRINDNATAQWMSDKIGTVDRLVHSVSVTRGGEDTTESESHSLVSEPVIFPHDLQRLAPGEVVAAYRGVAWRGKARAYYQRWPEYQGLTPSPAEVVGDAYQVPDLESA